jgi:hypothetical protein
VVGETSSEAGLTTGAIYAQYRSIAELFLGTVDLDFLLNRDGGPDLVERMASVSAAFDGREPS